MDSNGGNTDPWRRSQASPTGRQLYRFEDGRPRPAI